MALPPVGVLAARIGRSLVGRSVEIEQLAAALCAGRDVVLEGPPGVSKSTLLRATAAAADLPLFRVDGSAYLTPSRLVGHHDPATVAAHGYRAGNFVAGPLVNAMRSGGLLFIEELNRIPDDTLNVLLSPLAARSLQVPRFGFVQADPAFRVVAAMNPHVDAGATRLGRSMADRLVRIPLGYQGLEDEVRIVRGRALRREPELAELATRIVRATRTHPRLSHGASVRGAIDLARVAPTLADLVGREFDLGTPQGCELVIEAALVALSSRVGFEPEGSETVEDVLAEIVIAQVYGQQELEHRRGEAWTREVPHRPRAQRQRARSKPLVPRPRDVDRSLVWRRAGTTNGPEVVHASAASAVLARTGAPSLAATRSQGEGVHAEDGPVQGGGGEGCEPEIAAKPDGGTPDPAAVAEARRLARQMTVRMAKCAPAAALGSGRLRSMRYAFRSDDIDLDRTLEEIAENPLPEANDFWVLDRARSRTAYALLIDISGSMRGERLGTAALATAALAIALARQDVGVIAFWGEAAILKRPKQTRALEAVLADILTLKGRGLTNLHLALQTGLRQLADARTADRVGVLLSDGAHNMGPDPLPVARRYERLHVIATSAQEDRVEACLELAAAGQGRCAVAATPETIPGAVAHCLS